MSSRPDTQDVQAVLAGLGLVVPATDLPFLQRTLLRQRELLLGLGHAVAADTEAAHVFRVQQETADTAEIGLPADGHGPSTDV
jgi:hypothetical protein